MRVRLPLLLAASLMAVAPALPALAQPVPAARSAETPAVRLRALFDASDEASLDRNPISRLFRGDLSHAGEFGDGLSDAYLAAEKRPQRLISRRLLPSTGLRSMPMTRSAMTSSNGSARPISRLSTPPS
jgi:hypothetical protein